VTQFVLTSAIYFGFWHALEHNKVVHMFMNEDSFSCGAVSGRKYIADGYGQVVYWYATTYVFLWIDFYHDKNNTLDQYRIINPGRNPLRRVEWSRVLYAYELSFWTMWVGLVSFLTGYRYLFAKVGLCDANNLWFDTYTNKELLLFIAKLPFHLLLADMIFYFTHRLCHENKWLYKTVHKKHHTWNDSYACASVACHPIEHMLVNLPTVFVPQTILCGPYGFQKMWMAMATVHTCFSHCGSLFMASSLSGIPHDFHHHFQNVHFGSGGYCDWFFKTRLFDKHPETRDKIAKSKKYQFLSTSWKVGTPPPNQGGKKAE